MNLKSNSASENSNYKWLIVLAICLVLFCSYHAVGYFSGPSVASLTELAINGATSEQQHSAATELAQTEPVALEALRTVAEQSKTPAVVSVCILALSRARDYDSMEMFLQKLDDDDTSVRAAAAKVAKNMLGRDFHFPVTGSSEDRNFVRDQIIAEWNTYNGSELAKFNDKRFSKQ